MLMLPVLSQCAKTDIAGDRKSMISVQSFPYKHIAAAACVRAHVSRLEGGEKF